MDAAFEAINRKTILAGCIGLGIACVLTLIRLGVRLYLRKRLAWDDSFAALATLLLVGTGVIAYKTINNHSDCIITSASDYAELGTGGDGTGASGSSRVAVCYLGVILFDMTIWTSRLSVLATVLMFGYYTRYLQAAGGLFVVAMFILVAQVFWVCESQDRHNHWKTLVQAQCVLGNGLMITRVSTDAFGDIVLVVAPLLALRHLSWDASKGDRVRLRMSFAVGGLTTIVSIVQAYYVFKGHGPVSTLVQGVQLSVSVMICNFPVLAAAIHRIFRKFYPEGPRASLRLHLQSMKFTANSRTVSESGQRLVDKEAQATTTSFGLESRASIPVVVP